MNIKFALGDLCACADLSEPRLSSGVATNCCLGAHRKLSLIDDHSHTISAGAQRGD